MHSTRFSTLLDIDKLTLEEIDIQSFIGFSTLLDIDKLIRYSKAAKIKRRFSTLLDIDKLIPTLREQGRKAFSFS